MISRIIQYYNTIKFLKLRQLIFQCYRRIKPISRGKNQIKITECKKIVLDYYRHTYYNIINRDIYIFGKKVYDIERKIYTFPEDYMYQFSFNYYEFLLCDKMDSKDRDNFIKNFANEYNGDKYFLHPYTCSKRIIALFCLYSKRDCGEEIQAIIRKQLSVDLSFLTKNIEYHIDANHLLTNYLALALGYNFTSHPRLEKYVELYKREFMQQFASGSHYERSYSYAKQLLYEFTLFHQSEGSRNIDGAFDLFMDALDVLRLKKLTYCTRFGDNVDEQCCDIDWLQSYASRYVKTKDLNNSANSFVQTSDDYVCFLGDKLNIAIDAGGPAPSFQPGHAHDSTGAILVSLQGGEFLTCSHTSTYANTDQRLLERSRDLYSAPLSCGQAQQVWSAFRVAKRTKPEVRALSAFEVELHIEGANQSVCRSVKILDDYSMSFQIVDRFKPHVDKYVSQYLIHESITVGHTECGIEFLSSSFGKILLTVDSDVEIVCSQVCIGQSYGHTKNVSCVTLKSNSSIIKTEWNMI